VKYSIFNSIIPISINLLYIYYKIKLNIADNLVIMLVIDFMCK